MWYKWDEEICFSVSMATPVTQLTKTKSQKIFLLVINQKNVFFHLAKIQIYFICPKICFDFYSYESFFCKKLLSFKFLDCKLLAVINIQMSIRSH